MTSERIVDRVRSVAVGGHRSINSARTNHFVIDEPAHAGGPGEAPTPGESFLAGVSACGVLLVESRAMEEGVPLTSVEATIEAIRARGSPNAFESVTLQFRIAGATEEQAAQLVEYYKGR